MKVNYIWRSPGLPATVSKPYLIVEIQRCPSLLESIINQIQYVQICVCVNVGRGAGIPETMCLLRLITELGHGQSILEEIAHTRTRALTHSRTYTFAETSTNTYTYTCTYTYAYTKRVGFP